MIAREFPGQETVNHSAAEYVRGEAYTNTIEGVFSIFKRGMKGATATSRVGTGSK